jgi:nucleoid-associated protein YgaU
VRTARLVSVAGLVLAGLALAWPFRRDWQGPPRLAERPSVVDVPLRGPDVAVPPGPAGEASPALGIRGDEPTHLTFSRDYPDLESLGTPPVLPPDFGIADAEAQHQTPPQIHRNWQPARLKLPTTSPRLRRHRLTDGDSLERLAERYLGNPARAGEIFEANRDLLPAPDLLPLGRIIRIPPREADEALQAANLVD